MLGRRVGTTAVGFKAGFFTANGLVSSSKAFALINRTEATKQKWNSATLANSLTFFKSPTGIWRQEATIGRQQLVIWSYQLAVEHTQPGAEASANT